MAALKVVQIRGTSGSGKTHTAYEIMKRVGGFVSLSEDTRHPWPLAAQMLSLGGEYDIAIPGRYTTACGGCDTIKTQNLIVNTVKYNRSMGRHVIFEGLLISQIYQRYADLAREIGVDYWFCYLDTPLDKCVMQVNQRRLHAHQDKINKAQARNMPEEKWPVLKPLNETNTISKHRDCWRNREKDLANGFNVLDLKHDGDPAGQVLELLGRDQT